MNAAQRFAEIGWTVQDDGCWIWAGRIDNHGYGAFWDGGHVKAHRFALAAGEPLPPIKTLACHRCDVRACVNPDHLYWTDHKGNTADMIRKGRGNWRRKLTEETEQFIRDHYEPAPPGRHCRPGQWTARAIAKKFEVSDQAIHDLIRRMDARQDNRR